MPIDDNKMSEALSEIRHIFSEMKMLHQSTKERQEIWEKLIKEQNSNNKERLDIIDKRWGNLMKIVLTLTGLFLVSFVNNTISMNKRPTIEQVSRELVDMDCASKTDVIRGFDRAIDGVYETFERETNMTHQESFTDGENVKSKIGMEVTNYKSRGTEDGN